MCGRARLSSDVSEIKLAFGIPPERPAPNFAPSWKVAPTDPLPIVHYDSKEGTRSLDVMRWGLIPFRVFTQFGNHLATSPSTSPPTDVDRLDLQQGFADLRAPIGGR